MRVVNERDNGTIVVIEHRPSLGRARLVLSSGHQAQDLDAEAVGGEARMG